MRKNEAGVREARGELLLHLVRFSEEKSEGEEKCGTPAAPSLA